MPWPRIEQDVFRKRVTLSLRWMNMEQVYLVRPWGELLRLFTADKRVTLHGSKARPDVTRSPGRRHQRYCIGSSVVCRGKCEDGCFVPSLRLSSEFKKAGSLQRSVRALKCVELVQCCATFLHSRHICRRVMAAHQPHFEYCGGGGRWFTHSLAATTSYKSTPTEKCSI
jgi:hypothetical protein